MSDDYKWANYLIDNPSVFQTSSLSVEEAKRLIERLGKMLNERVVEANSIEDLTHLPQVYQGVVIIPKWMLDD